MAKCTWVKPGKYEKYHDNEHGKLIIDDIKLFERLVLEMMQPGLSYEIILKKQENFKVAFSNYDLKVLGNYCEKDVEKLLNDSSIVRHELKIRAVIHNAQLVHNITNEKLLIDYIVDLLDYRLEQKEMIKQACKELKNAGFKFIGPSVFESLLQSIGLLNGHMDDCEYSNLDKEYRLSVPTPFGLLDVKHKNYKIIYAKYNETENYDAEADDAFAYVIVRQTKLYEQKQLKQFRLGFDYDATPFQRKVYDVLIHTSFGDYLTYKDVAHIINSRGYQAVGSALNKNKIQFFIPCHRVGNKDKIGGFAAREDRKAMMLDFEGANTPNRLE